MLTRYKVTFEVVLASGHPSNWVPETIEMGLEFKGEVAENFQFEEMPEPSENTEQAG